MFLSAWCTFRNRPCRPEMPGEVGRLGVGWVSGELFGAVAPEEVSCFFMASVADVELLVERRRHEERVL